MDPLTIALGLAQVAPMAVKWLAGDKAGEAAADIGRIAMEVTGHTSPEEALDMLKGDPLMGREFSKEIAKSRERLDALYLADRQDARRRELTSGRTPWEMWTLAAAVITGLLMIAGALFFITPEPTVKDALLMIIGSLITRVSDVYGYYFGGSKGDTEKSAALMRK